LLFKYTTNECSYVVESKINELPAEGEIEINFVARINGGRGRIPKGKTVDIKDLEVLVDFETAQKLMS